MNNSTFSRLGRICCKYIFPLVLLLYPLRHVYWGLDFWDTGYNYANFRYMGLEHMDSMWLFATYLSNLTGHFLTLLPGGHTLLFMNLYTGLFVSLLALVSYYFLTKRMRLPAWAVFVGELAAVSLCWCPTALLYNYLTYVLFLAGVLLLYEGLSQEKNTFLALAGVMLGSNVFVRFSNLPEAGLIVAVWVYGFIACKKIKKVLQETGFCILGYVGAVSAWLGLISLRYGFSCYVNGIKRLFAMTEIATDYKAASMLYKMFSGYVDHFYWVSRILVFALPGILACFVFPKGWKWIKGVVCAASAAACAVWLYGSRDAAGNRNFCDLRFDEYSSMLKPGILFLILTLAVCLVRIFSKKPDKKEKLFAGLVFLSVFITSIGSNNGLLPSLNNLFLAAPYVLWNIYGFCTKCKESRFPLLPLKALAIMFVSIFLFQGLGFGVGFAFAEATGIKKIDTKVENNDILKGIYMSGEKAAWMEGLSAYVSRNGLEGREVILYGNIPSVSFYLGMPSAFNPWSDLTSFGAASMEAAMKEIEAELSEKGEEYPVVILNRDYVLDLKEFWRSEDVKLDMILQFMEDYGYRATYVNDKFVLYENGGKHD